jgi:hypothetical protein
MWERKTTEEIRRVDRRLRFSPLHSLGWALFAATFTAIFASFGYWGDSPAHQPQSLEEVFRASAFIFVLIFLGLYILQSVRKIPMNLGRAGMICGPLQASHRLHDRHTVLVWRPA